MDGRRGRVFGSGADAHSPSRRATVTSRPMCALGRTILPRSSSRQRCVADAALGSHVVLGLRWTADLLTMLIASAMRRFGGGRRLARTFGCPAGTRATREGSRTGKPRRASGAVVRKRAVSTTDFRAEEGLVAESASPTNGRGAWECGDADLASRKGKALEGGHRRESAEATTGMSSRGAATR
jgi:hypothetical protein